MWRKLTIKSGRNLRKLTPESVTLLYGVVSFQPNDFFYLNKKSTTSLSFRLSTLLSLKLKANNLIFFLHLKEIILS